MSEKQAYSIPGRYDRIAELCAFITEGAREAGFGVDALFRIELACDEACTNIIQHAYGEEGVGNIDASWQKKNNAFIVTIWDKGAPFDPASIPDPRIPHGPQDLDNMRIGGLGIHFMRTLMDEVEFSFVNGRGNKLVMTKYLKANHDQ